MSIREAQEAVEALRLRQEMKESGRLLGAAGFTEFPGARSDGRVAHRAHGKYYDLVIQFDDGHMEAIRQLLPDDEAEKPQQLWVPSSPADSDRGVTLWSKSGDPIEVTQELLLLPTA